MSISAPKALDPVAVDVRFDGSTMRVRFADGRELGVPLSWFPKLRKAGSAQRNRWRLIGKGVGIHWSGLDEDLSVAALLRR